MRIKNISKFFCMILSLCLIVSLLAACGGNNVAVKESTATATATATTTEAKAATESSESKAVTLTFLSNAPDRKSGEGLLEQTLIDNYMKENSNVTIQVEAVDKETEPQKLKAYSASDSLTDLFMLQTSPSILNPLAKGGFLAELNPKDYENYEFYEGAIDAGKYEGKLYALPRNADIWLLMYNQELFSKNNIKVPTTMNELKEATKAFRKIGIAPCSMNGKDKWNLATMWQDFTIRTSGGHDILKNAIYQKSSFEKEPTLLAGTKLLKEMTDMGFFQDSLISADYGEAQNMFVQGKSAMYYIGTWEMGINKNPSFPEAFRKNVRAMILPSLDEGPDTKGKVVGRFGGGYAIASKSKQKEEAVKLYNYIFKPENMTKIAWKMGITITAQRFDKYLDGSEGGLQKDISDIFKASNSWSFCQWNLLLTPSFENDAQTTVLEMCAKIKTPEQMMKALDTFAKKDVEN